MYVVLGPRGRVCPLPNDISIGLDVRRICTALRCARQTGVCEVEPSLKSMQRRETTHETSRESCRRCTEQKIIASYGKRTRRARSGAAHYRTRYFSIADAIATSVAVGRHCTTHTMRPSRPNCKVVCEWSSNKSRLSCVELLA